MGRIKRKAREFLRKAINQMARLIAEFLVGKGVSRVFVGSSVCSVWGQGVQSPYRGLVVCGEHGYFNADLSAACNLMKFNNSVKLNDKELKRVLNNTKTFIYLVKK